MGNLMTDIHPDIKSVKLGEDLKAFREREGRSIVPGEMDLFAAGAVSALGETDYGPLNIETYKLDDGTTEIEVFFNGEVVMTLNCANKNYTILYIREHHMDDWLELLTDLAVIRQARARKKINDGDMNYSRSVKRFSLNKNMVLTEEAADQDTSEE